MKKVGKFVGFIVGFVVVLIIVFEISIPLVNNYIAARVANRLKNIPLPEETEYVESISQAGKLVGNGNGMQYFGCILVRSELNEEELQAYYAGHMDEDMGCGVEVQSEQMISFIDHRQPMFRTEIQGEKYFIIYTFVDGPGGILDFDLRGH